MIRSLNTPISLSALNEKRGKIFRANASHERCAQVSAPNEGSSCLYKRVCVRQEDTKRMCVKHSCCFVFAKWSKRERTIIVERTTLCISVLANVFVHMERRKCWMLRNWCHITMGEGRVAAARATCRRQRIAGARRSDRRDVGHVCDTVSLSRSCHVHTERCFGVTSASGKFASAKLLHMRIGERERQLENRENSWSDTFEYSPLVRCLLFTTLPQRRHPNSLPLRVSPTYLPARASSYLLQCGIMKHWTRPSVARVHPMLGDFAM